MSTPASKPPIVATPSGSLIGNLRAEVSRFAPFAQMDQAHVDRFIASSEEAYFAPGETIMSPDNGVAENLFLIRQGSVTGRHGLADTPGSFEFEAGDLFPIGALMGARAVTATYSANADTYCLLVPASEVRALSKLSAPFADFLNRRVAQVLDLWRRALQAVCSSQTLAEESLEANLGSLPRKVPAKVASGTPLLDALRLMHERHVGSVIVVDAGDRACGILTRHDIVGRVAVPQVSLDTPIDDVMSAPVLALDVAHTAQDAAMLMSRHRVRHVPVTEEGRVVSIVSERDLFVLQRLSLNQVSTGIRAARDIDTLRALAQDIRRLARNLLGQGVQARQLTELLSHLNDLLTEQMVQIVAERRALDLNRACWLAFGSEGRSEQTITTDQDNGLVFDSEQPRLDRPAWLAFALEVNEALDACGYPSCRGHIMASNPECCLTQSEWVQRFSDWMEHGAPEDLLNASIYFDLRPLAGRAELARPLRDLVTLRSTRLPRFIKQIADNALRNRVPLNWRGGISSQVIDGREVIDLKMQGTVLFVDVARLYALSLGISATSTRARFESIGRAFKTPPQESESWVAGFEFLQMLRLKVQMEYDRQGDGVGQDVNPNLVEVPALNEIERSILKETLRVARRLQQRVELDYKR